MKKNLTFLTGFVFLITILVAGGCSSASNDDPSKDLKKVKIYLKAVEIGEEIHLEMYDSNNPGTIVVDDLYTDVDPGTKIVWRRAKDSKIKRISEVAPRDKGEILVEDAKTILLNKRYRARVPDNKIDRHTEEKYIIKFVYKIDNKEKVIDPYLKIR